MKVLLAVILSTAIILTAQYPGATHLTRQPVKQQEKTGLTDTTSAIHNNDSVFIIGTMRIGSLSAQLYISEGRLQKRITEIVK